MSIHITLMINQASTKCNEQILISSRFFYIQQDAFKDGKNCYTNKRFATLVHLKKYVTFMLNFSFLKCLLYCQTKYTII